MPLAAATTKISVEEYLRASLRPDCDYVDGELQERNVGTYDHSVVQFACLRWFWNHRHEWRIRATAETRMQVTPERFRIPDVAVLSREQPIEQILTHPPLVCIEVLSAEDTLHRLRERLEDYRQFGVGQTWLVDPATQGGYEYRAGGFLAAQEFAVPGTPIRLSLVELFAELD